MIFSVTDVVVAARCPRQFVLHRDGRRVTPGSAAIGQAAHAALTHLMHAAHADDALRAALDPAEPEGEQVRALCYRLAYHEEYRQAATLAPRLDAADLGRLDALVRSIAALIAALLCRARRKAASAGDAVVTALRASEEEVVIEAGEHALRGRVDLVVHDAEPGLDWIWDLKTYAGSDAAQAEQVRVYALAYRRRGLLGVPALLHVTGERVEIARAAPLRPDEEALLAKRLAEMAGWLGGATPPACEAICSRCIAAQACWARWGRTLPDVSTRGSPLELPMVPAPAPPVAAALDPAPLWLGMSQKEPVCLEPEALTRHVAVYGASGTGKTCLAKILVEEAVLAGVPVLAFDLQGDLVQLASTASGPPELGSRRAAFAAAVEPRLLTPASDAGLRISLNPLRLPPADVGEDARARWVDAVADCLLGAVELPRAWRNVARGYLGQHLEELAGTAAPVGLAELAERVADPSLVEAPLLEDRPRLTKLVEQLRLLTTGGERILFARGRPFALEDLVRPTRPGAVPLNVLWLNALGDEETRARFIAFTLYEVYSWMLRHPARGPRLLLYFDEVGPYMPPRSEPASKAALKLIFQQGRKYGVCGLFCTQNLTDVDYKVLAQASTLATGRVGAPQDSDRLRRMLGASHGLAVDAAVDKLSAAHAGEFLVTGADRQKPRWLSTRALLTEHGPPWGEHEIAAHTTAEARRLWEGGAAGR